jgi:hypothetical protein
MTYITDEVLVHFSGSRTGARGLVNGDALTARFHQPLDIVIDAADEFAYVADYGNWAVRKVDLDTGEVTTFANTLLPGAPVRLSFSGEMLMVSCISPANPDWLPPVPFTEDEIIEYLFGDSAAAIDAHRQEEFDTGARWPASPGDLSNIPSSLNEAPGARYVVCIFPDGSLDWMRGHGNFNTGPFSQNGVDGAFIGSSGVTDLGAMEGGIGGWVIRSRNSGHPFGGSDVNNFQTPLGWMYGYEGYIDAAYFRPEAIRNHCYATNTPCENDCTPINPADPELPYEFYLRGDAAEPSIGWPGVCTQWHSATYIGVWDSGTSYNHEEAVQYFGVVDGEIAPTLRSYWYDASFTDSTPGVDPPSDLGADAWVVVVSPGAPAWLPGPSYSSGQVVEHLGTEYQWVGVPIPSDPGDDPETDSHWRLDFPCAKLPRDFHDHDGPADLSHSYWQDMEDDLDWCAAYNSDDTWAPYHVRKCLALEGFTEEPSYKGSPCPVIPPIVPPGPGCDYYSDWVYDRDGHYASDVGMILAPDGRRVRFRGYQYPSGSGLQTSPRDPDSYCVLSCSGAPDPLLPAAIVWSDQFGSTDFEDQPTGYAPWNGRAAWQLALGPDVTLPTPGWEMAGALHTSSAGMLETFTYIDPENVTDVTYRGQTGMPVRGVAYSPSRELYFFTTSASGGTYGAYTKEVDGDDSGVGYHQIMTMVPFVEVNPTATYHLGEISGSIESVSDDTTEGVFVDMHIEVDSLGVAVAAAVVNPEIAVAMDTGSVIPAPAYNEPPQLPDQFVREPNPLPPETEPRKVPLPPWIPDGNHRES